MIWVRQQRWFASGLCSLLGMCMVAGPAWSGEVPAARRLPQEVVLLFTCPSGAEFSERFQQTNFGRMINDPALADFRRQIDAGLSQATQAAEAELRFSLGDLASMFSGEITLAVVAPRGEPMGAVLLIEYGADNESLMDELVSRLEGALKQARPSTTIDTIEGVEVTLHEFQVERGNPFNTLAHFRHDGYLCLSSSAAAIESVLVRWDGTHSRTLGDSQVYNYILEKCSADGRAGDLQYFIDPIALMNGAFTLSPDLAMAGFMITSQLPRLGLDKLKGIGGAYHLSTEDFDSESRMFIYTDQPPTGVLKVFECPAADLTPPDWVSSRVQTYQCINWDIQGAYTAVERIYDDMTRRPGAFADLMNQTARSGLLLHPKDDIIDLMDGRIHVVGSLADPADVTSQQLVVALGISDERDAEDLLDTLTREAGGQFRDREFQGVTIYESRSNTGVTGFDRPSMAVTGGLLVFASDTSVIEEMIRASGSESPLSQSKTYAQVQQHLPSQVCMLGYAEGETQFSALFDMLRNGELDAVTEGAIDFSSLPEFSKIASYFTPSASYTVPDEKGALFVGFTLKAD